MASLLYLPLILLLIPLMITTAQNTPSPGYYPSSRISSIGFDQGYSNLWGAQHQRVDQGTVTIWLDSSSGPTIFSYLIIMQPVLLLLY